MSEIRWEQKYICLFILSYISSTEVCCFILFNLSQGCSINTRALSYCCRTLSGTQGAALNLGRFRLWFAVTDVTPGWCFWQGILWKRSGSSLNKEWKKKYVTLSNNGTLSYHSSSSVRKHHNTDQCDSKRAGGREDLQLFTFKGTGYAFRLFLLLVFERKTHSYLLHLQKFRYSSRIHEMWCYLHHILIQLFKSGPFEKKNPPWLT